MKGGGGAIAYLPWVEERSAKLTPARRTLISRCPGRGSGRGTSRSSSTSGPPRRVATIARTSRNLADQPVGRDRQLADPNAGRRGDRVDECRRARHRRRLADAAGTDPGRRTHLDDLDVDRRHLVGGRQLVVEEAAGPELAAGVVDELFAHRPSQALDRPAVDLAFHLWWVDGAARVLDRGVAGEAIRAGLAVDGDPAEVHGESGRLAIDPGPALAEHRGPGGAGHRQFADPDPPVGDGLDLHRTVADLESL